MSNSSRPTQKSAPSQLLERNAEWFAGQNVLLIDADGVSDGISLDTQITILKLRADGESLSGNALFERVDSLRPGSYSSIAIYYPKAKQLTPILLQLANTLSAEETIIYVVGENAGGIKSAGKLMQSHVDNVVKLDTAKKCAVFRATARKHTSVSSESKAAKENVSRLFLEAIKKNTIDIHGHAMHVCSMPGVFGDKALDAGTKLLLSELSPALVSELSGNVFDFACGSGVIGTYLAKINSELNVGLSDVSLLATACTEQTLKQNDVSGNVYSCDGLPSTDVTKYRFIVSNPPFHTGLKTDYSITQSFIQKAHNLLQIGGELMIVANSHLPYPEILDNIFGRFTILQKTNKFTLYYAVKEKSKKESTIKSKRAPSANAKRRR